MGHGSKIFVRRQNPFRSNKPTDLKDEREESGKIDAGECSQEEPSWTEAVTGALLRVKQNADGPNPVHERRVIIPIKKMRPAARSGAAKKLLLLSAIGSRLTGNPEIIPR
jgi:hypothetical protein